MKNKIILLLVLLIPSLCFGESVKFEFDYETGRPNALLINITHSALTHSDGNKKAGFNVYSALLNNGKILSYPKKEELSNDYEAFLRWMKETFPIGFDVVKNKWNPKENIIIFVENLMIFNGYTLVNTEDRGSQRYYFK